jgi:hypothetical protein
MYVAPSSSHKIPAMPHNDIAKTGFPSSSARSIAAIDPSNGQPFDGLQCSNAAYTATTVQAAQQCYGTVRDKLQGLFFCIALAFRCIGKLDAASSF